MNTTTEETGLATRTETSMELRQTAAAAEAQYEIQSAILIARKFPRNEDVAFEKLMKACKRTSFAEDAEYSFPRGKVQNDEGEWVQNYVSGASVNLAREAARVWGNIRYGIDILRDDVESRQIRGWAWDMETNTKVTAEDDFKKLVQRKIGKGKDAKTEWVTADERDLRELTNRRGAILVRNCILQILPKDLIEDAADMANATLKSDAEQDPELARKKVIMAFSEINVSPEMLEKKLGHPLAQCSPVEIANLRKTYASIRDGNSTWAEYAGGEPGSNNKAPEKGTLNMSDLKAPAPATGGSEPPSPDEPKKEDKKSKKTDKTEAPDDVMGASKPMFK